MTERRPPHESVDSFVERQIREAQERGEFDGLAGAGKPIASLGKPDDELWWVRRKLQDENIVDLPPALQARRARDDALADVEAAATQAEVVAIVTIANDTIIEVNRTNYREPLSDTMPLDLEAILARWRATYPERVAAEAAAHEPAPAPAARVGPAARLRRRLRRSGGAGRRAR